MRCTDPLLAIWYKPDAERHAILSKPVILCRYRDDILMDTIFRMIHEKVPHYLFKSVTPILLPCGKCDSCRLKRSAEWTFRNLCESKYHTQGCFLTLTVSEDKIEQVFPNRSLCHKAFQDFMKLFRFHLDSLWHKFNDPLPFDVRCPRFNIRYMMCGEYGDQRERPHYHVLLYGYSFPDRYFWKLVNGNMVYRSPFLESLWTNGISTVEELNIRTIQYVCRYVLKKATCRDDYGDLNPEYIKMSLKPGLGSQWFDEFGLSDVYNHGLDGVFVNDYVYLDKSVRTKIRPPRYFDKLFDRLHNADFVSLKNQRIERAGSLLAVSKSDLAMAEDYIKTVVQGRIKKGVNNV